MTWHGWELEISMGPKDTEEGTSPTQDDFLDEGVSSNKDL